MPDSAKSLANRRVVVMGLGRFGGGIAVTRFLVQQGASVLVTDAADKATLSNSIKALSDLNIEMRIGSHRNTDLENADLLVISPAVDRRKAPFFQEALRRGIPWTTEINLFIERCPATITAITGSIGKSTTCAMLHTILDAPTARKEAGFRRALLGGNIGGSLLPQLDDITENDVVVLELSSFQLECTPLVDFTPRAAGITNARPHHLNRYADFNAYVDAKLNLFRNQPKGGTAVLGTDDANLLRQVKPIADERGCETIVAARKKETYDLLVPGAHNQDNAHLAVAMAVAMSVSESTARKAVATFAGLPHRLELIGEVQGVRYYNDSKSTSAEAISVALEALQGSLVLLCGGKDTGDELARIIDSDWRQVTAVICFGDAGERLAELISQRALLSPGCLVRHAERMVNAVPLARTLVRPGGAVLLSPGCPSYDEFTNYEERGDAFRAVVSEWMNIEQPDDTAS